MKSMATSTIKREATENLTVTLAQNFAVESWGYVYAVRNGNIVIVTASGLHPTINLSGDTTCMTIQGVKAKRRFMSSGLGGSNNGQCTISILENGSAVKMNFCAANNNTYFEFVFATV